MSRDGEDKEAVLTGIRRIRTRLTFQASPVAGERVSRFIEKDAATQWHDVGVEGVRANVEMNEDVIVRDRAWGHPMVAIAVFGAGAWACLWYLHGLLSSSGESIQGYVVLVTGVAVLVFLLGIAVWGGVQLFLTAASIAAKGPGLLKVITFALLRYEVRCADIESCEVRMFPRWWRDFYVPLGRHRPYVVFRLRDGRKIRVSLAAEGAREWIREVCGEAAARRAEALSELGERTAIR